MLSDSALVRPTPAARAAPEREAGRGFWFRDLRISQGRVKVFDTGADLKFDKVLIGEALNWFGYHLVVRVRSWWMLATRRRAPAIWFAPVRPRPWYIVWSAAAWAGVRIARSPETADATFAFEDATWSFPGAPGLAPAFNFGCTDVSKTHVATVFEAVFGYPLALDPETWSGPAVEKGEMNGAHDGKVVQCPTPRLPGRSYQRLIDTRDGDFAYDLRTPCVGGRPVAVWIKRKTPERAFAIQNLEVTLHQPQDIFSDAELAGIGRFCSAMQVDWAGLDILRERGTGRLYIVDVNKTDVGPIIALSLRDKLRSTRLMSQALEALLADGKERPLAAGR